MKCPGWQVPEAHTPFSNCEQARPKNRQQDLTQALGLTEPVAKDPNNHIQKDFKCFPCRHTGVSKETFGGKTWHQSSHDFSGSHIHISAIIYHWAQRTESFHVEHFPSSICAPSHHSIQEPHSLSCICPHNIPVK